MYSFRVEKVQCVTISLWNLFLSCYRWNKCFFAFSLSRLGELEFSSTTAWLRRKSKPHFLTVTICKRSCITVIMCGYSMQKVVNHK